MPATPRHTSRARIEAKESSILDAAERIFAQAGFDGAKVSDIARAASVAEGTVYLYYKNKQDLLAGVVGRFWTQLTLGAEAAIEPDATTIEQLEQLGRYHLNSILEQFEVVSLTYRARPQQEQDLDQVREYVRCLIASCSAAWTGANSPRTHLLVSCATFSLAHWNFQRAR
jgi:TetR/AcrR family fatty acid metabolism transcriptional regulator